MISNYELAIKLSNGARVDMDAIPDKKGVILHLEAMLTTINISIKQLKGALHNDE